MARSTLGAQLVLHPEGKAQMLVPEAPACEWETVKSQCLTKVRTSSRAPPCSRKEQRLPLWPSPGRQVPDLGIQCGQLQHFGHFCEAWPFDLTTMQLLFGFPLFHAARQV